MTRFFALSLLCVCCVFAVAQGQAATDTGISVNVNNECVDLSGLCLAGTCVGNICLGFNLNSCTQSVFVNFTRNNQNIFTTSINSLEAQEQCTAQGICNSCVGFNKVSFTTAGVEICPEIRLKCPLVSTKNTLSCFSLGNQCAGNSCMSCTNSSNCGWCSTTRSCQPVGSSGPYCSSCSPSSSWFTELTTCPDYVPPRSAQPSSADALSGGAKAGIAIGVIVACVLLLFVVIYVVRLKKKLVKAEVQVENLKQGDFSQEQLNVVPPSTA